MLKHKVLKLAALIAKYKINSWARKPIKTQRKQLKILLKKGANTVFGQDHKLYNVDSYNDFKLKVPVRDYEQLKKYFDRIKNG